MAGLATIFTGMEQGAEVIESNFKAVNTDLTVSRESVKYYTKVITIPNSTAFNGIKVTLKRQGKIVNCSLTGQVINKSWVNTGITYELLNGYKPSSTNGAILIPCHSQSGTVFPIYTSGDGKFGAQTPSESKVLETFYGSCSWITDDDYPTSDLVG